MSLSSKNSCTQVWGWGKRVPEGLHALGGRRARVSLPGPSTQQSTASEPHAKAPPPAAHIQSVHKVLQRAIGSTVVLGVGQLGRHAAREGRGYGRAMQRWPPSTPTSQACQRPRHARRKAPGCQGRQGDCAHLGCAASLPCAQAMLDVSHRAGVVPGLRCNPGTNACPMEMERDELTASRAAARCSAWATPGHPSTRGGRPPRQHRRSMAAQDSDQNHQFDAECSWRYREEVGLACV